ncbi:MAG: ATP-grasp domain-containing protein, partial [Candidatus Gastranaerophilales bacterium]|nr:ATP-grasp domain-containing protein [Candidatus Gastranaerophilales bacterium]
MYKDCTEAKLKEKTKILPKNIFIFPCGSEIGLELYRSLSKSVHFNVIGGSSVDDHGKFVFENYIPNLPYIEDESFIDELNKIIETHKIDFIFPAHDSVVFKLAQNRDRIKCLVINSDKKTCEITRSKLQTYNFLKDAVLTPKVYSIKDDMQFPVFLKPEVGQGSKGCLKVSSKSELEKYFKPSMMILEYLPGREYTVDCFTDHKGRLLYVFGRERSRVLNGISVNSKAVNLPKINNIAEKINSMLKLQGVWFFQLKENKNGELCLLEIAPRVAGTMGLSRAYGVN